LNYGKFNPSIDPIFGPTAASIYWSSTTIAVDTSTAWSVDFFNGFLSSATRAQASVSPVRAVRGLKVFLMARPLWAVYHVINRGTARQATFLQEQDYEAFLKP
jgi:hypothetical protein